MADERNITCPEGISGKLMEVHLKRDDAVVPKEVVAVVMKIPGFEDVDIISEFEGKILNVPLSVGAKIKAGDVIAKVRVCTHPVQFHGLCTDCGINVVNVKKKQSLTQKNTALAQPEQVFRKLSAPILTISARKAMEEADEMRSKLRGQRKLSLLLDIDKTLLHAVCVRDVNEFFQFRKIEDPFVPSTDLSPPSSSSVKPPSLHPFPKYGAFTLSKDNYIIRLRPHIHAFFESLLPLYEMSIHTHGNSEYAKAVAKVIDPTGKIFGSRIITRDESGDKAKKKLHEIFPCDDMVLILDDRADVWGKGGPNLLKIFPFEFFLPEKEVNDLSLLAKGIRVEDEIRKKREEEEKEEKKEPEAGEKEEKEKKDNEDNQDKEKENSTTPEQKEDQERDKEKEKQERERKKKEREIPGLRPDGERDMSLLYMRDVLKDIHHHYYRSKNQKGEDVKQLWNKARRDLLRDVNITFCGTRPLDYSSAFWPTPPEGNKVPPGNSWHDCLCELVTAFGGKVSDKIVLGETTHFVVCHPYGNIIQQAYDSFLMVVRIEWLVDSFFTFRRQKESKYTGLKNRRGLGLPREFHDTLRQFHIAYVQNPYQPSEGGVVEGSTLKEEETRKRKREDDGGMGEKKRKREEEESDDDLRSDGSEEGSEGSESEGGSDEEDEHDLLEAMMGGGSDEEEEEEGW